ncbi:MAG: DUF4836 family protein [Bacteroidota bacterium]|nr:DUF4836 family protein [Bacteroidota bacterium]
MKTILRLVFAFCAFAFLFSSCSKKSNVGKMIPNTAMFVAQINTKSLNEKVSLNDIKQTSWYKKVYSDSSAPEWRKKILDNPEASGIDLNSGLTFFVDKASGSDFYMALEGTLKSEKDFEQFNKNFDSAQTVRKSGDLSLITFKDKNVVAWNDNHFVYLMSSFSNPSSMYQMNDSSNQQQPNLPVDRSAELSAISIKLFSLNSDSSLEKNEKFASLLDETGDLHFWQNTEQIMKSSPSMGMLGMLKLDAFFKDNISTYTVNFDMGKIEVNQKGYAGKELTDLMKKNLVGKINTDMIKNIPSQNVFAVFASNFKPEGIRELLKLTGTDGFVNMYAQQRGFTLDDVVKSNNGELMVAFTDFKMKSDSFNYKDNSGNGPTGSGNFSKPDFNFIFSLGIGDKASLQKLINAGKKMGSQFGKDSMVNNDMNDKTFAVSNSTVFAKQYLAGGNNKYDFTDKISGHPIGMFIDFHKIISALATGNSTNPESKQMIDQSLKIWNNLYVTGGDYTDGAFTAKTEINLVDQNTNSLQQLNNYFNEMYQLHEAKKSNDAHGHNLDSLLTPPPIDTVKVK